MRPNKQIRWLEEQIQSLNKEKRTFLEAIELAANLTNYRISLNKIHEPGIIIRETLNRIRQIMDFKAISFYLVNEEDSDFYQDTVDPEEYSSFFNHEVDYLIEDKTFFWALSRNKPVMVLSEDKSQQILLHSMSTASRTRGLFIGLPAAPREKITDLALFLFSITVMNCANALESFELYRQIRDKNRKLNENLKRLEESKKKVLESEEKYRALFEQAVSSIILYDRETLKPVEFNDNAHQVLGYTRAEFETLSLEDFEVDRSPAEIRNWLYQLEDRGNRMFETRLRCKNGTEKDFMVNSKSLRLRGKDFILSFLTDITQQKQHQKEREILEKQLRQAQKMESIGTLAGGIAHDFNNILGIILGYAELALLEIPEKHKDLSHNLQQLMKAVDRAKKLVKQILTFSRAGDESPQSLIVNPIITEAISMLRSTLPATIRIRQQIEKEPLIIMGNPTALHQILVNLCTNAAHSMQDRAGVLRIELQKVNSPGGINWMQLTVGDTGGGIPPHLLERVFDPYFTTKKPGEGTGLGLSVVHGIVKRYGGDITIASTPGKGTMVKVKIPIIDTVVKPGEVSRREIPTGGETILLVDDEEALLRTYRQILEQLNYTVISTSSSLEALELFRTTPSQFHLVICDMAMPQMTGIQLSIELLTLSPGLPIILCTGYSEFIDAKKARAVGIKEFLMKPVTKKILALTIRRVLDEKKSCQSL